jgi:16S rRNA (guanine527-N7)-methyltransferase
VHIDESLAAVEILRGTEGAIVDVGSGGGAPGIPVAAALPERDVVLLEATERKCIFLRQWTREFPNLSVIQGRAEEQSLEAYGAAMAKALAPPAVAIEWCLPLVRVGGSAILFVGPSAQPDQVASAAALVGGGPVQERARLFVVPKAEPTPPGFPRRSGVARKRPLA